MRVGFDVDGVLADFNSDFISLVVAHTGMNLFPALPFDILEWNYAERYGYTAEELHAAWQSIKKSSAFWAGLAPYHGHRTHRRIRTLMASNDVYFITNRSGVDAKRQTERWLVEWLELPTTPTVLISAHKGECAHALALDYYIDDRTENVQDVVARAPGTTCAMPARTWNRKVYGAVRLPDLDAFLDLLGVDD